MSKHPVTEVREERFGFIDYVDKALDQRRALRAVLVIYSVSANVYCETQRT
jgi:hypothetical protein